VNSSRLFIISMANTCYNNIIGLARADCPCIEEAPPNGYNTSTSGLFITDVPPFDALSGYDECGEDSVWDMLTKSREESVNTFIADTNAMLMRTFKSRRERFKGGIGEATGRDTLTTDKTYAGIRIACNPIRGGILKITHIGTLFSGSGTLDIEIFNSLNESVFTGEVDIQNGFALNALDTAISLPTYIEFDDKHEYYLTYTYNPANKPRLNNINCGCGGFVPWYNTEKPMWVNAHPGSRAWANWVMVGGWTGDTLTDFDQCSSSTNTQMNGITLQVELGCDIGQVLCNGSLDYTSDPFALSMAYAIRHKACEILASKLIASTTINRLNMVNRDTLRELKREWNAKYAENAQYIAQEAQLRQNDCLVCRDESGYGVSTILS
jgi:hypothetical protein